MSGAPRVTSNSIGAGQAPTPATDAAPTAVRAALDAAALRPDGPPAPPALPPGVHQVLDAAPVQLGLPGGGAVYAWGSLDAPGTRALLVRDASGTPEIIALHRHPRPVGTCAPTAAIPGFPIRTRRLDALAEARFGRLCPVDGVLFAVDADALYIEADGAVVAWDGRRTSPFGSPAQALASLVLRWSQR